ncbi:MFS general substrate transporter [Sanghuangporus baumii]|uniref:MFS general substrate transporter n=1 Tax=Sanghuangporus baumii TaxID=108892 RepID=A0A9Q5HV04_SANBA|nr:MFS general substrate transporter [Sanghuangporus baumii]
MMDMKDKSMEERATADVALVELGTSQDEGRQRKEEPHSAMDSSTGNRTNENSPVQFRLYRRRRAGVLGIVVLNIVAGMSLTWFGPIANKTSGTFGISLDEVNWLGNIVACTYIVVSPLVPIMCSRFGLRVSYAIGTGFLILSAWIRYAGTAHSLNSRGAYALLIIGQFISAIPQIVFQILAPKFSEIWFDLKGRTTATMLMSVSNPVGTALGQLIAPMIDNIRTSILVLGIISTAVAPFTLLIGARPPTPPSYSGSQPSHHFFITLRAIFGLLPSPSTSHASNLADNGGVFSSESVSPSARPETESGMKPDSPISQMSKADSSAEDRMLELGTPRRDAPAGASELARGDGSSLHADADAYMTMRERVDFIILTAGFSVLVAGINTFSILSNEILEPYGYSEDTAGLMGAALLLAGLVAAFATAPLFDRVLTRHLGLSLRIAVPFIAAAWLSLIWAVRPNNTGALYAIFVVIGVASLSMLPVTLELGCELTRNSEASSAILWWRLMRPSVSQTPNLTSDDSDLSIGLTVMSALRASSDASPPQNMHRSLIYSGASICGGTVFVMFLRGQQRRREKDESFAAAAATSASERQGRHTENNPDAEHGLATKKEQLLMFFRQWKERTGWTS